MPFFIDAREAKPLDYLSGNVSVRDFFSLRVWAKEREINLRPLSVFNVPFDGEEKKKAATGEKGVATVKQIKKSNYRNHFSLLSICTAGVRVGWEKF